MKMTSPCSTPSSVEVVKRRRRAATFFLTTDSRPGS